MNNNNNNTSSSSSSGSAQQIQSTAASSKSISFDDISKLFSLPLSDAATNLGVCTSVLKKICRDNGLVRWPYRQYLSGKSIEEIKKDAAKERIKQLSDLSKAAGQASEAPASSTLSSSFQLRNKTSGSEHDMSKSRGVTMPHIMQQQGKKKIQNGQPHKLLNVVSVKGTSASLDEFKYGFPSGGLSTVSYKWWGDSSNDGYEDSVGDGSETEEEDKHQSVELSERDKKRDSSKEESNISPQGTGLLMGVRRRAVEEGQEALKRQRTLLF